MGHSVALMIDAVGNVRQGVTSKAPTDLEKPMGNDDLAQGHSPSLVNKVLRAHPRFVVLDEIAFLSLRRGTLHNRASGIPGRSEKNIPIGNVTLMRGWNKNKIDPLVDWMPINGGRRHHLLQVQADPANALTKSKS